MASSILRTAYESGALSKETDQLDPALAEVIRKELDAEAHIREGRTRTYAEIRDRIARKYGL